VLFPVGVALALLSVFPKPLPTENVPPIPAFFADGRWKPYVAGGRTVVPIPLPEIASGWETQRIASMEHLAFPVPRGYFSGPKNPPEDLTASWSAPQRYVDWICTRIWYTHQRPATVDPQRVRQDLRYWKAGVVVLDPDAADYDLLRSAMTDALGPPQRVSGVELWDVRTVS
jgi:hypothetical protein